MSLEKQNRLLSRKLALVAAGMFGFGFALVPFYNQICAALGVNSIESRDQAPVSGLRAALQQRRNRLRGGSAAQRQ